MRLIDADRLCEMCIASGTKCNGNCEVKDMPTVDAVEVVQERNEDDFCSYGERKDGERV